MDTLQTVSATTKLSYQVLVPVFTMGIYDGAKALTNMNQLSDSRCLKVDWNESRYEIFPMSRVQSGNEPHRFTALATNCIN